MKIILALGAISLALAAPVAATTIDFTTFTPNTPVISVSGVDFSMSGGPNTATTPVATGVFGDSIVSLTNSDTNDYPTNAFLTATFQTVTSGVSFVFSNYGSGNGSYYAAYDALGALVSTALIDQGGGFTNFDVAGSGIKTLVWSNNSNGGSWQFGVASLTFGAVPEPASWALMLTGFGLVGAATRRRNKLAATAA